MKQYDFSLIIKLNLEDSVQPLIESIMKQDNISFEHSVQIIVVDSIGCKEAKEYINDLKRKYNDNLLYIDMHGKSTAECYNIGMKEATGKYIAFLQNDGEYSTHSLSKVRDLFEETNLTMVSVRPVMVIDGAEIPYPIAPKEDGILDLRVESMNVQLYFHSYFFRAKRIQENSFKVQYFEECKLEFLLTQMLNKPKYAMVGDETFSYGIAEENHPATFVSQHEEWWYTPSVRDFYIPFLERCKMQYNRVPNYISCIMVYLLFAKYNCNLMDRNKGILEGERLEEFYEEVSNLLTYIRYPFIVQKEQVGKYVIPKYLKVVFLEAKAKKEESHFGLAEGNGALFFDAITKEYYEGDPEIRRLYKICNISSEPIMVYAINYIDGNLVIDAMVTNTLLFAQNQINILVQYDEEMLPITWTQPYNLLRIFGKTIAKRYCFSVSVPVRKSGKQVVTFYQKLNNQMFKVPIRYMKSASRITHMIAASYWCFGKSKVLYAEKGTLCLESMSPKQKHQREQEVQRDTFLETNFTPTEVKEYRNLRKKYWSERWMYQHRRIWISFDKLYKAGDNGEYLFRYINSIDTDIEMYYIIKKESPDYERLIKENKNVLVFGSEEARLMSLYAEVILATHVSVMEYCGFDNKISPYFRDLFNAKIVCVQHGLTIQNIAQYQNRLYDNTLLYCCASQYEIRNIERPIYDYKPESLKLCGLARYDGLKNNDQKQILITPTWRREVVNTGVAHNKKSYNEYFKNSEYYRIYNSLINDKKLIDTAKKYGYKIIYLLHPAMSSQIVDYTPDDYVDLVAATGDMSYEKILTESSLMVTDYSGVQFDFAYMRKPIIYYHPNTLPPHYGESDYFKYESMGFGPICEEHEQLVDTLCDLMENHCKMSQMYVDRANDFFAFDDYNNCQRIYEEVLAYSNANPVPRQKEITRFQHIKDKIKEIL